MVEVNEGFTVLLIEDHALVRSGLRGLVLDSFPEARILEASTLQEARSLLDQADHILLDVSLPDGNGLEFLPEATQHARVTVLTAFDTPAFRKKAMNSGAHAFLSKNASPEELKQAMLGVLVMPTDTRKPDRMSPREQEVFLLIGLGLGNQEICDRLSMDEKTLYTHRRHIQQKLGLRDSQQLLHHAVVYHLDQQNKEKRS